MAFSWASNDRLRKGGGCNIAGARFASGGTDIREANGADEGASRLAWGLHGVTARHQLVFPPSTYQRARTGHIPASSGCLLTVSFDTGRSASLLFRAAPLSRLTGLSVRLMIVCRDSVVRFVSVVVDVFLLWNAFFESVPDRDSSMGDGKTALVGRLRCCR